jgi:hypothetical protein
MDKPQRQGLNYNLLYRELCSVFTESRPALACVVFVLFTRSDLKCKVYYDASIMTSRIMLLFKLFTRLLDSKCRTRIEHTTAYIYSDYIYNVCVASLLQFTCRPYCTCVSLCVLAIPAHGNHDYLLIRKHVIYVRLMTEFILIYLNYFRVMLYYWQLSIVLL